ncbi:hypothetical protein CRG98_012759 [Punica granatum]|uniref:Uncharacterized protein n=1 Tax=Punica granatum TaxID=22663 RepID=A0A2I0KF08_PUNGR|nr:hypothetical protein CRG98_012759 [Punica granatum]
MCKHKRKGILRLMLFRFGSPEQPVKSFCFGDANGIPFSKASIRGPPGLLPAMDGHIEMFSMMPQRLYWLFDVPVSLRPFSSGHRRAAAFVTRIGISVQIWLLRSARMACLLVHCAWGRNRLGRLSRIRESIRDCVGCAEAQGDCFAHLSFYSPFATVTRLGAVPLNLKGMNSPFATAAHKGFPVVPLLCPNFCLGRPEKGFRPSGLDSFVSRVCKGEGFEGFDLRVRCVLSPSRNCVYCSPFCRGLLISSSNWRRQSFISRRKICGKKCKVDPWKFPHLARGPWGAVRGGHSISGVRSSPRWSG